jgi:hypothetical protein
MKKHYLGLLGAVGTLVAGLAGCGSQFNNNCAETRTCSSPSDGEGGGADETPSGDGRSGDGPSGDAGGGSDAGASSGGTTAQGGQGEGGTTATAGDAGVAGERMAAGGAPEMPINPPPTVVSVTPAMSATDIEPDAHIVVSFSEPIDPATATSSNIKLMNGRNEPVSTLLVYLDGKVTLTPAAPLGLLDHYSVAISTDVKDLEGAPLAAAYKSDFTVRKGAWKTVDVAKDTLSALSETLPIAADGSVLVTWLGGGSGCPAAGRTFLRNQAPAAKSFPITGESDCEWLASGGNEAGSFALAWQVPDSEHGNYAQQFRNGAWQAAPKRVSVDYFTAAFRVVVSPGGVTSVFEHNLGSGTSVSRTDATGTWSQTRDTLSSLRGVSAPNVAFDSQGNGLAIWTALDVNTNQMRIVTSNFSKATSKWGKAVDLPGSQGKTVPSSPSIAFDSKDDALAVWVSANQLKGSRLLDGTWSDPVSVSDSLKVTQVSDSPGLVFDGKDFVAAWVAQDASSKSYTFTARFDLASGWDGYEQRQAAADGTSSLHMPRLVSDGRGHSLLVWAKGAKSSFSLVYQRDVDGVWGATEAVSGGAVTGSDFEMYGELPLSMNRSGLGALAWLNRSEQGIGVAVRLASFF